MRSWLGVLEILSFVLILFWVGKHIYFIYICLCFIVHSSPYLCVYGDDRITCYPGANDVTGEPGDV